MWLCPVHSCSGYLPDMWIQSYQPAGAFRRHTFLWTLLGLIGGLCSPVPLWSERMQRSKISSCGWNSKKIRSWVFLYVFIMNSRGALNIFAIIPDLCLQLPSYTISTHSTQTYIHKHVYMHKYIKNAQGTFIDPGMTPYSLSSHGSLTSITVDFCPARRTFNCSYVTSVLGKLELNLRSSNTVAKSKTYNK